ncbi:YbaB/EbfC family DNA-binding protein [Amycolatopsis minnesotensis]|uniref:YbaB/EbfC DNA-binding family protein n=1 Tax=Amycolatopsis minnesotensis TaxID=337894 RepID=A0ABN2SF57_9PSEU
MAEIDFDREVSRMSEQVERAEGATAAQIAKVGKVTGAAEAPDGVIRVEVSPGGLLTRLELSALALRGGSDALAAQIMHLADRATRRAGDRMFKTLSPVVGQGGERHLRSLGYEPLPDDEDDPSFRGYGGR